MGYEWRRMSPDQRQDILRRRQLAEQPWHGPPHAYQKGWFHISAACYEHRCIIGAKPERLFTFSRELVNVLRPLVYTITAWCVLPTHYHLLLQCPSVDECRDALGRLHNGTATRWNREDCRPGRTCWHRCLPKRIRSDAHRWATTNYIHHNPVHHGYARRWLDWQHSSAREFLESVGYEQARRIWFAYPVLNMGEGWDD